MSKTTSSVLWFSLAALTLVLYLFPTTFSSLVVFPDDWVLSPTAKLNVAMLWFVDIFGFLFKGVGRLFEWLVSAAQIILQWLPWSVTALIFCTLAYAAAGWRLTVFTLLGLLYMAGIGYWSESMNTLAIVLISVPMALLIGFAFGVLGFYSERAKRVIMPMLDLLQTIPAFAYLLPILMLFGFGTTVGLMSSVLYAFPPVVRNTILGLQRVSPAIVEAGEMSGTTASQLFWRVRLPSAKSQILLGVNQTTMAALSMVIIASVIGGTNDIGWEVLLQMRKAQFGDSLLSGFVIALMAMILDRVTYGFATRDTFSMEPKKGVKFWHLGVGAIVAVWGLSLLIPFLSHWPDTLVFYPADAMNNMLEHFVINYRVLIETFKTWAFFFLMLPVKIGFSNAVSPHTWGFAMTPLATSFYALGILIASGLSWRAGRTGLAITIGLFGIILYIGLTNMPWLALFAVLVAFAGQVGGRKLGIGAALGLGFLIIAGIWPQSILSLYLCGVSVLVAFSLGTLIGIWASQSKIVSAIVRPIIDTLQTMPLFVILIPFVMLFKIGEFTALLAIVAYSIVPAIRYTEHGLRNLPADVIEAATTMGCKPAQLLFFVKLPLALPAIMLGLNQTIIYGIGMLVIAALVGTSGLGQLIYIGLSDGDFGVGITAGIGMAIIAMIADRITQAISRRRQAEFGLEEISL